jgi:hypothetical protein
MAGIAATLQADCGLVVMLSKPRSPSARRRMNELGPAIIAFDLNDPDPGLDITLIRERPGLLLIGVNLSTNALLVLSGQPVRALSITDLVKNTTRQVRTHQTNAFIPAGVDQTRRKERAAETQRLGGGN